MDELFKFDYYRMAGIPWNFSIRSFANWLLRHNIRFAFWFRFRNSHNNYISKFACYRLSRKFGLEFSQNVRIGKGLYIGHPYNITVGDGVVMGDNINIHKGATVGVENRGTRLGAPTIGNNVYIGINATVIGKIHIGNDVLIAPGAFVNFDVPSHSIVLGNPGKIIPRKNATEGYIRNIV